MSYEKVSGIRMNPNKNILEFKSHSNNDDCEPGWWPVKGETFIEKIVKVFDWWNEGSWQSNGKTGNLLTLRYAFFKFKKELEKAIGEYPEWDIDNGYEAYKQKQKEWYEEYHKYIETHKEELLAYVLEKDTKACYYGYLYGYSIIQITNHCGIGYGSGNAKLLTHKQCELVKMLRPDLVNNLEFRKAVEL